MNREVSPARMVVTRNGRIAILLVVLLLAFFSLAVPVSAVIPETNFTATPVSGTANLTVQFTNTSTNNPLTFNWSFGDGSLNATVQDPIHIYTSAGTYPVSLTISNITGNDTATKPGYITVTAPPAVVAGFKANITSGAYPLGVQFTDQSTSTPTSWLWTFGDGATSTIQNPDHLYVGPGWYTVTLNAGNFHSNSTATKTEYITVVSENVSYNPGISGVSLAYEPSGTEAPVLDSGILGGSLAVDGNSATITNPNPSFSRALFQYAHLTQIGTNFNGTLNSLQMTAVPYTTTLIGVGNVGVQVILNLESYNPSGTFFVRMTNKTSAVDNAAFSTAAGSIRPLRSVDYEMDLLTSGLSIYPNATIYFTVQRTWSDAYGSDNIRLFRNHNGVITILPATLDSTTATTATYRAITPDFSRFAPCAIGTIPPTFTLTPTPTPVYDYGDVSGSSDSSPACVVKDVPKVIDKPVKADVPAKVEVLEKDPEEPAAPPAAVPIAPVAVIKEVAAPPAIAAPAPATGIIAAFESGASAVQEGGARASGIVNGTKPLVPADGVMPPGAKPYAAVATGVALAGITAIAGSLVAGGSATASGGILGTLSGHLLSFFHNGIKSVMDFVSEHITGKVEDRATEALERQRPSGSQSLDAERNSFLFGRVEVLILVSGAILYGLAFVVAERLGFVPAVVGVYILVCGAVVVLHELTHHLIARKFVMKSEVRLNMTGILTTFLTAWFFGNVFSQPLTTKIPEHVQGEKKAWGLTMLAGPVISLVCAVAFAFLIPVGGIWTMIGTTGLTVNLVQIVFSLIPVKPQDGKTVFAWSKLAWGFVFIPLFAVYLLVYLI